MMPDVNVLLAALRGDGARHEVTRAWLDSALSGAEPIALSELVLFGVVRIITNPRIYSPAETSEAALAMVDALRVHSKTVLVRPGARHWEIFSSLCNATAARAGLVSDAYHAALAIEHGCEFITLDRDFKRFPGLRWRSL
jgi:uncharacterized protein